MKEHTMDSTRPIETLTFGIRAKGRSELIRHLNSVRLTPLGAVLANCYDCQGGYEDGKMSCKAPRCSFYDRMPYRHIKRK